MNPMRSPNDAVPEPPRLRTAWTTWILVAFAVIFVVLTVLGIYSAGKPGFP
jgi:hypothetical protein